MTMNGSTNPFGGGSNLVDKRVGNAYPIVKAVYDALEYLKYLADNLNALRPKDIELRMDEDGQYIQWRYAAKGDEAASPWQDLWTLGGFFDAIASVVAVPDKIPKADGTGKISSAWLKLDEIAASGTVTQINNFASLPVDALGLYFVAADETKDGAPTLYYFANNHRYWVAMTQDD